MKFDIMTLFPDMVDRILSESVIGRAREAGFFEVACHDIRAYSKNKHRNVDDTAIPLFVQYRHFGTRSCLSQLFAVRCRITSQIQYRCIYKARQFKIRTCIFHS